MNVPDTRVPSDARTRPLSRTAAIISITAGFLVLFGWRFGVIGPLSGPRGFRVMQPNTALAFILAGASLWCALHGTTTSRRIGRTLAVALLSLALLTMGESALWPGLHFYRLFAPFLPGSVTIALMSQLSAFCFTLLGIALLSLGRRIAWRRIGHLCALSTALLATIVLVDYAYNLTLEFRLLSQSLMALHTALTMVAIASGVLAAQPDVGFVRVLARDSPGAALTRTLLPVIVAVPFLLGWIRLHAQQLGYLGSEAGAAATAAASALICAMVVLIYARRVDEIDDVRSAAEKQLRDSAQFHRQILDSAQEGIVVTDRESRFLLWNRVMEQLSGLREADVLGHRLRDMFPSFKDPRSFEAISRVLRGETAARFDAQRPFAEAALWFAVNHAGLRSATGEVTGVIVTYRDITDRKNAEQALRESSRFNQQIIDNLRDGIAVFDRELHVVAFNPFLEAVTGIEAEAAIGSHVLDVLPQAERHGLREALQKALAGETVDMPDMRQEVSERESWSWIRLSPLRRADGEVSGVLAVISDISERKRTEVALRLAQERTSTALAAAKMADWEIDLQTRRVTWSENLAALFGRPLETFDSAFGSGLKFIHQEDAPRVRQALEEAMTNRSAFVADFRVVLPDGHMRWLSSTGHVSDTGERGPRLIGIVTDVTERRTLESHLRQAQKMDAVGQLAGGIAHDFNNLLTAILGYAQFLAEVVTDPRQTRDVNEILSAANRAAALTRQLLAFSRREPVEITTLDVNQTIGGLTNMLQRLVGEHVDLGTSLASNLHAVRADRGQLEQVLVNLVVNARDAMPGGGSIRIETSNLQLAKDTIERTLVTPGPYVQLAVTDTGVGIAEAIRPRIFEPFFTTKEPGKGTGLGLATVYGIVSQAGGHVSVYTELGHGTTIKVYLPAAPGEAERVDTLKEVPRAAVTSAGTVLVVEDEDAVRSLTVTILERAGYSVFSARNPQEAEAAFRESGHDVALLLTDVIMPGGTGPDLHRRLSASRSPLPVLYMSGYTGHVTLDQRRLETGAPLLQKPFDADLLLRAVRQALNA
jgi:two-component system, cell cycle sensor histidine kinase and response regulator CckA